MKRKAQLAVLIASAAAIVFTFGTSPEADEQPVAAAAPVVEPPKVTLRVCAKEVLARAVVERRLSLPEAAALWRAVHRRLPDDRRLYWAAADDPSEAPANEVDQLFGHVIRWVKTLGNTTEAVARLEAEYRDWRQSGAGRLPDLAGLDLSPDELLNRARDEWLAESRGRGRG
jgi:hypothetical protein